MTGFLGLRRNGKTELRTALVRGKKERWKEGHGKKLSRILENRQIKRLGYLDDPHKMEASEEEGEELGLSKYTLTELIMGMTASEISPVDFYKINLILYTKYIFGIILLQLNITFQS